MFRHKAKFLRRTQMERVTVHIGTRANKPTPQRWLTTTRLLRQQPSLLEPKILHLFSQDASQCEASTARTVNFLASTAAHWGGWRERRNAEADKCACAVKIRVACCAACRFASEAPHVHTTPSLRLDTSGEWDDTDCQMVSRRVIPFSGTGR